MKDAIQSALKDAMRAKDKVRMETIRGILSAIQYDEIQTKTEPLPAEGVLAVLQREIKKRREEIEFAEKAARNDLLERLALEVKCIEAFLPAQLDSLQLEKIINDLKQNTPGLNLGAAMKALKEKYSGQYDSKAASEIAKRILS